MRAIWNGEVIAESEHTIEVEGNAYFPPEAIKKEFLVESKTHTTCPWKGIASYYSINVNGNLNIDAVWYYSNPKPEATEIKGYYAFWNGVEIK